MAHYIVKENEVLNLIELSDTPLEVGLDKIDFNKGLHIEVSENEVQNTQQLIEQMTKEPEYDEEGNEFPVWNPTADDVFNILFPAKFYYIKSGKLIDLPRPLNPRLYQIGKTYEDYLNGKYVLLNEEQVHYYLYNPVSTIYLIYHLGVTPEQEEPTIAQVRMDKLYELRMYCSSKAVNEFTINNKISAWFTPEERVNYTNSINAAKLLEQENLAFAIRDNIIEIPTEKAEMMLAAIQLYADACNIVTRQHEMAINNLDDVEEIKDYDFTASYPNKLNFDL